MENNRSIYVDVIVSGQRNRIKQRALVDTGAEVSLMPSELAKQIGAWPTYELMNLVGIHGDTKTMPVILSYIHFRSLNDVGGLFRFAMAASQPELIIGMDTLKPLGIVIDTKTHQLSIKNEIWEAFKVFSAIGVIVYGVEKLLESLPEE